MRISTTILFAGLFALLAVGIGVVAVGLVGRGVEERVRTQLDDTVRLCATFPLTQPTARQLARYIHAEVVLTGGKHVLVTSLDDERARAFEERLAAGTVESSPGALVASAPLDDQGRKVWLLYPSELISEERARATRPVVIAASVGVVLAALVGAWKERAVVRERTQALERLVSALAHEIKNPLGAIKLTVEMLREEARPADREAADVVISEVDRLSLLVDEMRLLGGKRIFQPRPVSPAEAVLGVRRLLGRTLEHREVKLEESVPEGVGMALVDPRALQQVLLNLLLNAIDASPRGGTIRLAVERRSQRVRFSVQDEGPGVPGDVAKRLFSPFVTTKDGGTGLGLALARLVAEEHRGSLELVPSPRGALFVLELPAEGA